MKSATDYVSKQRLERLVPAVERALKERKEKQDLQKAEREREESEQRFQALMETIVDPLLVIVAKREQGIVQDFIVLHLNNPACGYLSISMEEADRQSIYTVVPAFREAEVEGSDLRLLDHLIEVVETGISFSKEIVLKGYDYTGQQVVIEARAARFNDSVVFSWRDVTERYQVAEQLQKLLAEAEDALNQVEQANRFKDEFLATVSHELKSPLSAIKGWAKILERQPEATELVSEAFKVIDRNTVLLENLIADLLDVSQIVEGRLSFSPELLSFEQIQRTVVDTIDTIAPVASQKGIHVRFRSELADAQIRSADVSEPVPNEGSSLGNEQAEKRISTQDRNTLSSYIMGDEVRLQQVIRNLLSNAIKFTPKAGQIEITLGSEEEAITLAVEDTGKGIEAADLPNLFERFWQARATSTESEQQRASGLGLGLSISHYIVDLHHGSIQAASEGVNKGSTFTIKLPTLSHEPVSISSESAKENGTELNFDSFLGLSPVQKMNNRLLQGIKALTVGDHLDALEMYKMILEIYGAEVVGAASVETAMVAFTSFRPDIIISDIGVSDVDGYTLVRRIRSLEMDKCGDTPAIALTAFSEPQYRTQALLAGFQMHITKPIGLYELVEVVAKLTHRYSE